MSSLSEINEVLRRQTSNGLWLPALATPSGALGECLQRSEPRAANVNRPRAGFIKTLVQAMKRRQTANLLKQLDPRLLDDIGVTRGNIDEIATKAVAEAAAREGTPAMLRTASLAKLPASILTGLTKAWRRQAAIASLERLSNHTLADIGMERARIAEAVDVMMAGGDITAARVAATPAQPKPTAKPATKTTQTPARAGTRKAA